MKKTIAVILIAFILLSLSACNQASDHPIVPNASNTLEATAPSTIENATTASSTIANVTTAPSTTPNASVTPNIEGIPNEELEDFFKNGEYSAEPANSWTFRSVDEFETFMATGYYPNQEELFQRHPDYYSELIPPRELLLKIGYIPSIFDIFGFNRDHFDKTEVVIVKGSDHLSYHYSLVYETDSISISVSPTPFCDVTQARDFIGRGDLCNNPPAQQFGDVKVEYGLNNGRLQWAYFTIDNYLISICGAYDNSPKEVYRFMHSEEAAPVVPLFTQDATTVEAFVKKVCATAANQLTAS